MSIHQVAQILQYQDSEIQAEHSVITALDGVASTYIRRENLGILDLWHAESEELPSLCFIDCAVMYYPVGPSPTNSRSLEHLAYTPISAINPALVLCMKGPSRWPGGDHSDSEPTRTPSRDLAWTLRTLASTSELSVESIVQSLVHHSGDKNITLPSSDACLTPTIKLPACAMPMGLIYDSEQIHLVAHIPYLNEDGRRYLCMVVDSLPFPSQCNGDVPEFIRGRYRVALALLSLQHHISRLVTLLEHVHWPDHIRSAQEKALRSLLEDRAIELEIRSKSTGGEPREPRGRDVLRDEYEMDPSASGSISDKDEISVLYTHKLFRVEVNFPAIERSQSTLSRYQWIFINALVMQCSPCVEPLRQTH
ncbi:hypothetical protein EVJ58_g1842 [Rhodofomes roseus]|uniref:Uncharacterized protein n=1 Tax=Rhodofomes roseus TaxID=34475 RepID=A0A4Y9YZ98_9APHY|nr:hypothetical protein EVJ58_g1842 [Rhodofomes roseus]